MDGGDGSEDGGERLMISSGDNDTVVLKSPKKSETFDDVHDRKLEVLIYGDNDDTKFPSARDHAQPHDKRFMNSHAHAPSWFQSISLTR